MALIQSLLHSESRALQSSAEQQEAEERAKAEEQAKAEEGAKAADLQQAAGVQVATVDSFQVPLHDSIPYREGLLNNYCCF